jgi:type II secretory pathway pseudopilin PulG
MQQTLLALLGLLVVTMLSFSQQRVSMQSQQQVIEREYRQMALGVAKQSIEAIRARPYFDGALEGDSDAKVDDFTDESSWGGKDCIQPAEDQPAEDGQIVSTPPSGDDCTAIEDFHDDGALEMNNSDGTIAVQIPNYTILFQVEFEVNYVEEDGDELVRSDSPTPLKEVTIRVQDCPDDNPSDGDLSCEGEPVLNRPIVFSEVIGYTG